MLTIAILTCDRLDMTRRTVESFLKHNGRQFNVCYGDDASTDNTNRYMSKKRIPCVFKHKKRLGCSPSSDELVHKAVEKFGDPYILYLQNDFESIRSVPIESVIRTMEVRPDVGWIRLYGKHKNNTVSGGNPTNPTHKYKPGKPIVKWENIEVLGERIQIGDIHWSYHPSINRRDVLLHIIRGAKSERDASIKASQTDWMTARFVENVTNHIGIQNTTPGGLFGKEWKTYE